MAKERANRIEKTPGAPKTPRRKAVTRIAVEEWHRTARFYGMLTALTVCVWKISDAVVKIMDKPAWLSGLIAVLTLLGATGAPSALLFRVVVYVRRWTREHVARESRLEQTIDAKRTSSGLTYEGTDPKETDNVA
jgi:hypothetical protein